MYRQGEVKTVTVTGAVTRQAVALTVTETDIEAGRREALAVTKAVTKACSGSHRGRFRNRGS
jgi:hypothetical protein